MYHHTKTSKHFYEGGKKSVNNEVNKIPVGSTITPTTFFFFDKQQQNPLTWHAGRMMQGMRPRNQRPVKLVMGVRGAAVRHITMSDTAMLHTNRFIPVCRAGVLGHREILKIWQKKTDIFKMFKQ